MKDLEGDIKKYKQKLKDLLAKKLSLINNNTELIEINSRSLSLENNILCQEKVYQQLLDQGNRYENLINVTEQSINYYRTLRDTVETSIITVKKSKNYSIASRISIQKVHTECVEWEKNKENRENSATSSDSTSDFIMEAGKSKKEFLIDNRNGELRNAAGMMAGSNFDGNGNRIKLNSNHFSCIDNDTERDSCLGNTTDVHLLASKKSGEKSIVRDKRSRTNNGISDIDERSPNVGGVSGLAPRGRDSLAYALNNVLVTNINNDNASRCKSTANLKNNRTYDRNDISTSDNSINYSVDRRDKSRESSVRLDRPCRNDNTLNSKSNSNSKSKSTLMRIKKENEQSPMSVRTSMTCAQSNEVIFLEEKVFLSEVQSNVIAYKNLQNRNENENEKVEMRNISSLHSLVDSRVEKFRNEQTCRNRLLGTWTGTGVGTSDLMRNSQNCDTKSYSLNHFNIHNNDPIIENGIISNVQNIIKEVKELEDSKRKSLTSLFSDINQKISTKYY